MKVVVNDGSEGPFLSHSSQIQADLISNTSAVHGYRPSKLISVSEITFHHIYTLSLLLVWH